MKTLNWHKRSLRFRLIATLSLASIFVWLLSTAVAWFQVRKEVNQVFDAQQILFAERLASSDLRNLLIDRHNPQPRRPFKKHRFDDDALAFAIFTPDGNMRRKKAFRSVKFVRTMMTGVFFGFLLPEGVCWLPWDKSWNIAMISSIKWSSGKCGFGLPACRFYWRHSD